MKASIILLFAFLVLQTSCNKSPQFDLGKRYLAAYNYVNNPKNLLFWSDSLCDEKYSCLFPININTCIYPNSNSDNPKDAKELCTLINIIFNKNLETDLYMTFSRYYQDTDMIAISLNQKHYYNRRNLIYLDKIVLFHITFNKDNTIKKVDRSLYEEQIPSVEFAR